MTALAAQENFLHHLVAKRHLSQRQAEEIVRMSQRWGVGPAAVMRSGGWARPKRLADWIASYLEITRNGQGSPPFDPSLLELANLGLYRRAQALPWSATSETLTIAAVDPFQHVGSLFANIADGRRLDILVITQAELQAALGEAFGDTFLFSAINALSDRAPDLSARKGLNAWQTASLVFALSGIFFAVHKAAATVFVTISLLAGVFFAAVMLFRAVVTAAALLPGGPTVPTQMPRPSPSDRDLAHYTIVVALHHEAEMLPATVRALKRIDYPAAKLDILLVLEERDLATRRAAARLDLDDRFSLITVPHSMPQTKPKACNYALNFARGDFVTIYDAEDRPDPAQIRDALEVLENDLNSTCVQGRLAFYNADENWLTRQFALEFATWFELTLPGLERLGLPIPLGGTSNHFRTDKLQASLGWDPFNVTEDADLGIRLKRFGSSVRTMPSTTLEEANCQIGNWVHQRSRWLKGYLQTFLVHTRSPARLWRDLGPLGFFGFHLLIGAALPAALLHSFFWGVLALRLVGWPQMPGLNALIWMLDWSIGLGVVGNGLAIVTGLLVAIRLGLRNGGTQGLILSAISMPLYWFLISAAAVKALFSFASRPFYWAKTRHGLSRLNAPKS